MKDGQQYLSQTVSQTDFFEAGHIDNGSLVI
jgi:hypothetical protein